MREEWLVQIMFKMEEAEGKWSNARFYYPGVKFGGDRYCKSEPEAKRVLDHAYEKFNGVRMYNDKGERYEVDKAAPGINVTSVITPKDDDYMRIVKHRILMREVTDWEKVQIDH